jgi:hypothetical protein
MIQDRKDEDAQVKIPESNYSLSLPTLLYDRAQLFQALPSSSCLVFKNIFISLFIYCIGPRIIYVSFSQLKTLFL